MFAMYICRTVDVEDYDRFCVLLSGIFLGHRKIVQRKGLEISTISKLVHFHAAVTPCVSVILSELNFIAFFIALLLQP